MDDPNRNIYKQDVDFAALALQDKVFAKYLKSNGQLDFTDPDVVRQLTKSLLQRDFELQVDFPEDRLCPPLPNRLNYVLWVQDLLDCTTRDEFNRIPNASGQVTGIDIGTGACAIYPLLACSQRQWKMFATELDQKNIQYAEQNIQKNELDDRIKIIPTTTKDPLVPLDGKILAESIEFTLCNPPFYESLDEMIKSAKAKSRPPFSACTGAEVEMVTPGGEVAFVGRMINESLNLRDKVQWYTSMLGKLTSVTALLEKLQEVGNKNYAVTELVQGSKTKRWALAWSWRDLRPTRAVGRNITSIPKHLLPFPPEYTFHPQFRSITTLIESVQGAITPLDINWTWDSAKATGVGYVMEDVWSRRARRKRQQQGAPKLESDDERNPSAPDEKAGLVFTISVRQRDTVLMDVTVRWVKGLDHVLFESFCGMLKRKVESGQ